MIPTFEMVPIGTLKTPARHARVHTKKQLAKIGSSIQAYGFVSPAVIDAHNEIVVGVGRVEAARAIGLTEIPAVRIGHLNDEQIRAFRLADNRLCEIGQWDPVILAEEFTMLGDFGMELATTGFEIAEIDDYILTAEAAKAKAATGPENRVPEPRAEPVSRLGDFWTLGTHRLICGDSLNPETYAALLEGETADLVFTDPPWNIAIDGFVGNGGAIQHREFVMASGEMTRSEYQDFLTKVVANMAKVTKDGGVMFGAIDWRHVAEMIRAGEQAGVALANVCVWAKTNASMGGLYRSQHELVVVFKVGAAPITNNAGMGATGRSRSNVWRYAGVNSFGADRMRELERHPTAKPVDLVRDAIRDFSDRGEIVLDPFGGSGSTLIAAHSCGRRARLIELDPIYCDVICRRWAGFTGRQAVRVADGVAFEDAETQLLAREVA